MGRWAGGWLGLGQYHSRDKASAYANWGKLLSLRSPVLALARPCYTNLTSLSLSLFLLLPLSCLPTPPTFYPLPSPLLSSLPPSPDCSTQEEETSHSCAHSFYFK